MRITILLLILAIVAAFPSYKVYKQNYHRQYTECGSMSGSILNAAHQGYGALGTGVSEFGLAITIYTADKDGRWKILVHDAFTGHTCTMMLGESWAYALPRDIPITEGEYYAPAD